MKNKKLFAILTLVCFMFTLMPVAAFAASFDEQDSYVYVNDSEVKKGKDIDVELDLNEVPAAGDKVYVWFEEDGYADVAVKAVTAGTETATGATVAFSNGVAEVKAITAKNVEFTVAIDRAGDFTVHAATTNPNDQSTNIEDIKDELRTQSGYKTVTVKSASADSSDYVIKFDNNKVIKDGKSADITTLGYTTPATNGIDEKTVSFTVYEDEKCQKTVYASDIDVDTTSGISVNDLEVKRSGKVSFDVTVNKAGTHKIYITIGDYKATIKVDAREGEAETIELSYISKTPVSIDSAKSAMTQAGLGNWMVFKVYDSNGTEVTAWTDGLSKANAGTASTNYVTLTDKPADSDLKSKDFYLSYVNQTMVDKQAAAETGWVIKANEAFDEEGTYTFKVALDDGVYATASITVKEAGDPVSMNITYDTASVQLGADITPKAVVWLDANYVSTKVDFSKDDVKFAVSGAAVKSVNGQTITVKDDEKYVGSTIKVTVIDEDNNLSATKTLTVSAEAKELVFDTDAVPVDSTKTINVKLVDEDGNTVGLDATTAAAYVIVLDKPAGADATVGDASAVNAAKGQFTFTFSGDTVGTYEVQAVLTATVDNVVRYYTGTTEIKVGATGIEDTVVMSIGSSKIVVNDKVVVIDAAPMIKDSRTFVPFRALAEAFGATVAYDEATNSVTAELDGTTVVMTINSTSYTVNGVTHTADVAPFINGSRTMVPVRFVAEAFGINVTAIAAEDGSVADVLFTK